jgi:predicted membrane protein
MENESNKNSKYSWNTDEMEKSHNRGRAWGGIILIAAGGLWLAHALNAALPAWLFDWPTILVFVGLYMLGKNGFKHLGGLIVLIIGATFMLEHAMPGMINRKIVWPVIIMGAGIFMIFNPWRNRKKNEWDKWKNNMHLGTDESSADFIDINAILGGVERTIVSKNFRGGEINCIMGGAEINLMHADIQGSVVLEVNTIMGGMEITVPSNWKIQSEVSAILGGVSDKRAFDSRGGDPNKVLILKGNTILGGVEIKAY